MDYIKYLFEMLGVEPKEEFKLKSRTGKISDTLFKIDEDLAVFYSDSGYWFMCEESYLHEILTGKLEIIKIPHPTAKEQLAIDYARACGCKWIAKDENNNIFAYTEKPYKIESYTVCWYVCKGSVIEIKIPISFIHWEDDEPYYIDEG